MLASQIMLQCGEDLTLVRYPAPTYLDGKLQKGVPTRQPFRGSVQPLGDRDLQLVPEGDRVKEQYYVFTGQGLRNNDHITRKDGSVFQVQGVSAWSQYVRARIVRVDVGPAAN